MKTKHVPALTAMYAVTGTTLKTLATSTERNQMNSNLKYYQHIIKAYNLKLERLTHPDFTPMQYKIVTSCTGNMAALFKIESMGTPFYSYSMRQQTLLHEWCYETFVDVDDECFNMQMEYFDITQYLDPQIYGGVTPTMIAKDATYDT